MPHENTDGKVVELQSAFFWPVFGGAQIAVLVGGAGGAIASAAVGEEAEAGTNEKWTNARGKSG